MGHVDRDDFASTVREIGMKQKHMDALPKKYGKIAGPGSSPDAVGYALTSLYVFPANRKGAGKTTNDLTACRVGHKEQSRPA